MRRNTVIYIQINNCVVSYMNYDLSKGRTLYLDSSTSGRKF